MKSISAAQAVTEETVLDAAIEWRAVKGKGRGVFARRAIRRGEVVERAPVIPMAKEHVPEGDPPDGYVLDWDEDTPGAEHALVLGYIMLYNHGKNPNLAFESDFFGLNYGWELVRTGNMTLNELIRRNITMLWSQCSSMNFLFAEVVAPAA